MIIHLHVFVWNMRQLWTPQHLSQHQHQSQIQVRIYLFAVMFSLHLKQINKQGPINSFIRFHEMTPRSRKPLPWRTPTTPFKHDAPWGMYCQPHQKEVLHYFKLNILFITVGILFNYLTEVFIRRTYSVWVLIKENFSEVGQHAYYSHT